VDQTTKARRHKGRAKRCMAVHLRLCHSCALTGSNAGQPQGRSLCRSRAGPSGFAAMSSGRGWLAWRGLGSKRPVGPRSRAHAKARSREDSMKIGQIFARALGPRRWSRSQAKAIPGHSRGLPGGPACTHALALGGGSPVGPES